jgi:hypothetical protein
MSLPCAWGVGEADVGFAAHVDRAHALGAAAVSADRVPMVAHARLARWADLRPCRRSIPAGTQAGQTIDAEARTRPGPRRVSLPSGAP